MLKKILFHIISGFIIVVNGYSQNECIDRNFIEWDFNNKITWGNFHAKADSNSDYTAECITFFKCSFYTKNDSVFCRVRTFFNTAKSWRKQTLLDNSYDINHEQLHFNITEIFARKIRQLIITNSLNEESVQKIYNENVKACNDFQNLYDKETNHSINKIKQANWAKEINTLLLSLNPYKEQSIYIKNPFCKICWK